MPGCKEVGQSPPLQIARLSARLCIRLATRGCVVLYAGFRFTSRPQLHVAHARATFSHRTLQSKSLSSHLHPSDVNGVCVKSRPKNQGEIEIAYTHLWVPDTCSLSPSEDNGQRVVVMSRKLMLVLQSLRSGFGMDTEARATLRSRHCDGVGACYQL